MPAKEWCNLHPPKSKLSYLAWELVEGVPHPVSYEDMKAQNKNSEYDEPSEESLLNLIHRIPLEANM